MKKTPFLRWHNVIALAMVALAVGGTWLRAESPPEKPRTFAFYDPAIMMEMRITGEVTIDQSMKRTESSSGALKLAPGAIVVWPFRDQVGVGTIEMWVYDDGTVPANPKGYGAGAMWGVSQGGAPALLVGHIYAPYLNGVEYYAASDLDLAVNRATDKVQFIGLPRKKGWHQWTFDFSEKDGLKILCDGQSANERGFNWKATRLAGFNGVRLMAGAGDAAQSLWVSEVTVTMGSVGAVDRLWPAPPPAELTMKPVPQKQSGSPYAKWERGLNKDPSYFPIAVWCQGAHNAKRYQEIGVNLYVGQYGGLTEAGYAALKGAGMQVICDQNEVGLKHLKESTIVGWMFGDEPDNAQGFKAYWNNDVEKIKDAWPEVAAFKDLGPAKPYAGYGPPIPPKWVIREYEAVKKKDPSRPFFLNLGCGVAFDMFEGRGEMCGRLDLYPEYLKGCDIGCFDIYPVTTQFDLMGNLWTVPNGVLRLRNWSADEKPIWACIECTHVANPSVKPTPSQVRSIVWLSLIHGARGLVYFAHQFAPSFIEPGLLEDKEMAAAVAVINKQITELAAVLNSPTLADAVTVTSSEKHTPVHVMVKKHAGTTYAFAGALYHRDTKASIQLKGMTGKATAEVLGESRTVPVENGLIQDDFKGGYAIHLYRISHLRRSN
ncbi:MAG: hypothetical protein WCS52_13585 [bacterium]